MAGMIDDSEPRVGERRPGGRAARVRAAVLEAASDLLDEVGYDGLRTEDVANRAGVHRTTVYRRWPSKSELVADAVGLHADQHIPIPDTGALHADLLALARAVAATNTSPVGARRARSLVAAAATSDELADALHAFMEQRMVQSEAIVERAAARGDLAPDTDPRVVIEPVVGAIWFRLLLTGEPIDDEFLRAVTAAVCAGVAPARDEPIAVHP